MYNWLWESRGGMLNDCSITGQCASKVQSWQLRDITMIQLNTFNAKSILPCVGVLRPQVKLSQTMFYICLFVNGFEKVLASVCLSVCKIAIISVQIHLKCTTNFYLSLRQIVILCKSENAKYYHSWLCKDCLSTSFHFRRCLKQCCNNSYSIRPNCHKLHVTNKAR